MKLKLLNSYEFDNVYNVLIYTLKLFNLKFTVYKLKDLVEKHLDNSSFSAIQDILADYGIQSTVIRKGTYLYDDFQTPFICLIKKLDTSEKKFTVVKSVANEFVEFLDTKNGQLELLKLKDFEAIDEKIILLIDDSEKKNEYKYEVNRKEGVKQTLSILFPLVVTLAIIIYNLIFRNAYDDINSLPKIFYLFSLYFGTLVSALLLWQEVDSENPFFKKVCGGASETKTDCDLVLSSTGSKFLTISWSTWGFGYFFTLFVSHLFFFDTATTTLCVVSSLLVAPYIIYSFYYQFFVVKKWCTLCIAVQLIIGVSALVAGVSFANSFDYLDWKIFGLIVLFGPLVVFLTHYTIKNQKALKKGKTIEKKWRRLRYDQSIFNTLLSKQPKVLTPTEDFGIVFGNPEARTEIIKVCNPYCTPCAIANKELSKVLAKSKDVKVRIVFNASGNLKDKNTLPVVHFLAIADKYGADTAYEAINQWFLSATKDYKEFAANYHIEGDIVKHLNQAKLMNDWCIKTRIRATPSFFIDGKPLPDEYNFEDFKYLF